MHQYLRAVGFSQPPRRLDIFNLIKSGIAGTPAYRAYTTNVEEEDSLLAQYDIALGDGIGISVCGQFDDGDEFFPEYYYPYLDSDDISTDEAVTVERRIDNNSFAGVVEDYRVGVSLIYRVRNSIEYIKNAHTSYEPLAGAATCLSALSLVGTVLLPIYHTPQESERKKETERKRLELLHDANQGNPEALQNLTLADMDTYANMLSRITTEDVYSLVDSYLMPAGSECELYSILGEIRGIKTTTNNLTDEEVVILTVDTNGLVLDIAINRHDLVGEPAVGRRFKGRIWLQGRIRFANSEEA